MKNPFSGIEIHWLKLIGALLLISVAFYLPIIAASPVAPVVLGFSAVLSAVGGALLSDSFVTEKRFIKSITPRLNSVNRLLATITSQVSTIIVEEKKGTSDNHAINRLSEIVPSMRAVITDVSDLAGEKFNPNVLNETIGSIDQLITQLESGKVNANPEQFASFLRSIKFNLKNKESSSIITALDCPYDDCEGSTQFELNAHPSTSQVVHCEKCDKKFHAQRQQDGSVHKKLWGASAGAE